MPSLAELQSAFAAALTAGQEGRLAGHLEPPGTEGLRRLAIHRGNAEASLAGALGIAYPAVLALVGEQFFHGAALDFARRHRPSDPWLTVWGQGFDDYLAQHPACSHMPWLAGVARLEWAIGQALHCPDSAPLAPGALAGLPADMLTSARLAVRPGVSLQMQMYPVDAIRLGALAGGAGLEAIDLGAGPVFLAVMRCGEDIRISRLERDGWILLEALATGRSLGEAAGLVSAEHLAANLARLIGQGYFDRLTTKGDTCSAP